MKCLYLFRFKHHMLVLLLIWSTTFAKENPLLFPIPHSTEPKTGRFILDDSTKILLPTENQENELFLARLLVSDLSDFHLIPVQYETTDKLPTENFILAGTIKNKLVYKYCVIKNLMQSLKQLGEEGYILSVSESSIVVASVDEKGALYGVQSLRQLLREKDHTTYIPAVYIADKPMLPFRGIRMYVPGRENFTFFKRFLRDFMSYFKFNKLILEMNAAMRLDRHPELNAGALEFAGEMNYSRRGRPEGPGNQYQNSAHHDAADGSILEKEEVGALVDYARQYHIEVIPEIPSLTHAYYLLNRHRELAEIAEAEWPDTYCPSNPKSYELLFDVFDEYIEVMQPHRIHIGKDEWRMPVDVCPRCKGKDYRELFIQDVQKIHEYLTQKGIKVAMWGDHLVENVRNKGLRDRKSPSGYEYKMPGALSPEQVKESIPKDILIFNWFWGEGENDLTVENFGFKQVYGNFRPNIGEWEKRSGFNSLLGGAPSSWAATTELNFGKDLLFDFLGCANLLWSSQIIDKESLVLSVHQLLPVIRTNLSATMPPSNQGNPVSSLDISASYNATLTNIVGYSSVQLKKDINLGNISFSLAPNTAGLDVVASEGDGFTKDPRPVTINADASSLVFLHACRKEANNEKAYRKIYNFEDTADLLGWYEIVYQDGFIETIPLRYGVNILDYDLYSRDIDTWPEGRTGSPQNIYCYYADAVNISSDEDKPVTFYIYEWTNPRFGQVIESVRLKSTATEKTNSILLKGLGMVDKRQVE